MPLQTTPAPPTRHSDEDAQNNFDRLWNEALRSYEKETGKDLLKLPFAVELLSRSGTTDEVIRYIGEQNQSFNVTPGGKAIFVAIGALLQAAKGVSELYDSIESLLRKIGTCLTRIKVYLQPSSPPNPALMDVLRMTLVQVFIVLGIVTKYCDKAVNNDPKSKAKKGVKAMMQRISELYLYTIAVVTNLLRKEDYSRVFLGETDVEEALKELEELTEEEQLIAAADTNAA
ncbi:hypothetical protein PENSPDRAFT_670064 [Peniophora sp. CONT]|nr:hypothetical protein PENSPDRAFT_670064 [Peniophora sp. CONT]